MWYHIDGQEIVVCGTTQIVRELWYVVTHRLSGDWCWGFETIYYLILNTPGRVLLHETPLTLNCRIKSQLT